MMSKVFSLLFVVVAVSITLSSLEARPAESEDSTTTAGGTDAVTATPVTGDDSAAPDSTANPESDSSEEGKPDKDAADGKKGDDGDTGAAAPATA